MFSSWKEIISKFHDRGVNYHYNRSHTTCVLSHFSCVRLFATLWLVARQAPLPMGFFKQEYWSRLPFPSPRSHITIRQYIKLICCTSWTSLVTQMVKNLPAVWETRVLSLGWENPLEEGMATHTSILAWRIHMYRGAWWVIVHVVSKSHTSLSN